MFNLSQYKNIFHISNLQVDFEFFCFDSIIDATRQHLTIDPTTVEILESCVSIMRTHKPLSQWGALSLAFCVEKGYCLVTNDIQLQEACSDYNIPFVSLEYIEHHYINGGGFE